MSGIITFVDSRTVLCYFIDPNLIAGGFDQYNSEPLYWELDSITVNHCTGNWQKTSAETMCPRPFLGEGGMRLVLNRRVF